MSVSPVLKWYPSLCGPMNSIAHQAPRSMGFPGQEYWRGLPFPPPGDPPDPGIESMSSGLAGRFFTTAPLQNSQAKHKWNQISRSLSPSWRIRDVLSPWTHSVSSMASAHFTGSHFLLHNFSRLGLRRWTSVKEKRKFLRAEKREYSFHYNSYQKIAPLILYKLFDKD